MNAIPEPMQIQAEDTRDLHAQLDEYATTNGKGIWTITIIIEAQPSLPLLRDRGNNVAVTMEYSYYEPEVTKEDS
jgi:hypothetical protein